MSDKPSSDLQARARWQRWEMDSLEALRTQQKRRASDAPPVQAEALKRRAQALAQARKEGLEKGYQEGFEKGLADGHAQGLAAGHTEGHATGLAAGRVEGQAQGYESGRTEGSAVLQENAARLDALAQTCAHALNQLEEEVGQSLIQLATRIAEQVLQDQLREHPDHILAVVQEVLQARPEPSAPLNLRLHPDDLALVSPFLQQNPEISHYRLIADEHLTRGGCVAETALGSVDATLEMRWQRIIASLGQAAPAQPSGHGSR
ncbi:flagellar assembly protein FliH [Castellaniella sp. FW104-16D08]|uniref:flagellar assembly protein FliH n=1 Tax=unclassified Castellaniella TaxID=2617606 RepID=UPI0033160FFB